MNKAMEKAAENVAIADKEHDAAARAHNELRRQLRDAETYLYECRDKKEKAEQDFLLLVRAGSVTRELSDG